MIKYSIMMYAIRFTLILILILFYPFLHVYSQSDATPLPQFISASPEVSAMVRVADIPISYYTGKPQFSLPLFSIKSGQIKHDIALSYTGFGGILVEQESTMAGLGFELSGGGAIAKSVIGEPDEYGSRGYQTAAGILSLPLYTQANPTAWLNGLTACNKQAIAEGRQDLMPDMFYLNFDGYSAKLFFDKNASPFISPFQPWKITGNVAAGYTIVIDNGTRYEFSKIESTINDIETSPGDGGSVISCNTAWYLTRIISATLKDTIQFNYTPVSYTVEGQLPVQARQDIIPGWGTVCDGHTPDIYRESTTFNTQAISTWMLSSITYPAGKIEYVVTQDRADMNAGNKYRIREINQFGLQYGQYYLLKNVKFYQSYANASATDPLQKRLLLDSISEKSGNDSLIHCFTYINPNALPKRTSYSLDHWGYFNGKNNTTSIPKYTDRLNNVYPGADREIDSASAQVGLLRTITYPTGGVTTFDYEPNEYTSYRANSIYSPRHRDSLLVQRVVTVNTNQLSTASGDVIDTIYIPKIPYQNAYVTYFVDGKIEGDALADVWIRNVNNSVIFSAGDSHNQTFTAHPPIDTGGTFIFIAHRDMATERAILNVYYRDYDYYVADPVYKMKAGGVRISRITKYDGMSHTNDVVRRFKYNLNDSLSSGVLLDYPRYVDTTYTPFYCGVDLAEYKGGDWQYLTRQTNSLTPLGRTQGSPIGYSKVTCYFGENGENGYEEFYHSITGLMDAGSDNFPYIPRTSRDDLRGLLLQHRIYNSIGKLLKTTVNEYNMNNTPGSPNYKWIWGSKFGVKKTSKGLDGNGCPGASLGYEFIGNMYQVFQFWPVISKTTDSLFDPNSNTYLTFVHTYTYDTLNAQIKRDDFVASDGATLSKTYLYPRNLSGSIYDSMVARNIVSEVIEKATLRNGVQTSKDITNYGFYNGLLVPLSKDLSFSSASPERRLTFYNYDIRGNVTEQGRSNDLHEVYIWGYNYQYPVARIVGSTLDAIAGIANNGVLQNPSDDNAVRVEIDKIRARLSGSLAEVFTYTYKPGIGITSETDQRGITIYYEYDGMGRLKTTKDSNGKIRRHHDYKYQVPINQ